ncbi:hypothetical protein GWK91_09035 [Virgibacillus sp. MSP4-1]|uniref:hypothetical protein n=1 Tax=Virgibacillus sp. MSP4-1 TaxID=2700081 RepID=UPI0005C62EC4|nr:hypothetical protein [Virgibacillus sp. MSP4-1]QHS23083.1 hypothetical protein GWK91_09035 [Virgibacillus sp. MSP4-1]
MNRRAFMGAWRKEWKMMKHSFAFILLMAMLLVIGMFGVTTELESGFTSLGVGVFMFPAYFLLSLNTEALQMQQFLHMNKSLHNVILAKFLNGLLLTVSYAFVMGMILFIINQMNGQIPAAEFFIHLILLVTNILLLTVFPTMIIFLVWSLYHVVRKFHTAIGIIAIILFLYVFNEGFRAFDDTPLYDALTNWGTVTWETGFPVVDFGTYSAFPLTSSGDIQFQSGMILFYACLCLTFYLISMYLLERKVEV